MQIFSLTTSERFFPHDFLCHIFLHLDLTKSAAENETKKATFQRPLLAVECSLMDKELISRLFPYFFS